MPGVTGREQRGFAFAKFGTNSWGVAASVLYGLRWESDGGLKFTPTFVEDRSFGETFLPPAERGDVLPPDLTPGGQARYEDHHYKLEALAMGSPHAVAISTSASGQTTSWVHRIDCAPSIDGLGATFAMDRKLYVSELTSAKIYGFSDSYGDGGILNQAFRLLGNRETHVSSVNINSTVYGANFPALGNKIFRYQGTVRMNLQSGGSLVAADAITLEAVEFSFERPQDRSFGTNSDGIIEPGDNEFPDIMVRFTYPRMNTVSANSLRMAINSGTAFKADWRHEGVFINSTDRYSKLIQFPHLELQDFETPTAGAAQVKPVAMFKAKLPASAPTGMAGVTTPFRITRIQVNSVGAFA